ncbi:MAG: hypothetical protein EBR79_01390 [Proteobacteria bacterium]|nr:hypothetical protein [Pseudomonadota bacterium]NBX86663.1 hypothetical protein [Pseudomonadota bacterium]
MSDLNKSISKSFSKSVATFILGVPVAAIIGSFLWAAVDTWLYGIPEEIVRTPWGFWLLLGYISLFSIFLVALNTAELTQLWTGFKTEEYQTFFGNCLMGYLLLTMCLLLGFGLIKALLS